MQRCSLLFLTFCSLCDYLFNITKSCAKTAEPIDMPFGGVDTSWPKEPRIRWGPRSPRVKGQFWGTPPCDAAFCRNSLATCINLLVDDKIYERLTVTYSLSSSPVVLSMRKIQLDRLLTRAHWPSPLRLTHVNVATHNTDCFQQTQGGSVAEWLACWTQVQKGLGSNHSQDAVR